MELRRIYILVFMFFVTLFAKAQSMSDIWMNMPLSKTPYLTMQQKKEVLDKYASEKGRCNTNQLNDDTLIDTLSTSYVHFFLSKSKELTLALLPYADSDTIILSIETYKAPEKISNVSFFDLNWKQLPASDKLMSIDESEFFLKPNEMSVEEFERLKLVASPRLISYNYCESHRSLDAKMSIPLVPNEEKSEILSILTQNTLKWDGKKFHNVIK